MDNDAAPQSAAVIDGDIGVKSRVSTDGYTLTQDHAGVEGNPVTQGNVVTQGHERPDGDILPQGAISPQGGLVADPGPAAQGRGEKTGNFGIGQVRIGGDKQRPGHAGPIPARQ